MSVGAVRHESQANPWGARRLRAEALRSRYPFAAEVLTLYLALLPVQEDAWSAVLERPPRQDDLPRWAVDAVLPAVVGATVAAGPAALRDAARLRIDATTARDAMAGWLAGAELDPVDRYLARASLGPVLEALGGQAGPPDAGDVIRCPGCGGPPQVAYMASSGEPLVTGRRHLICARCATSWNCSRTVCPACGEHDEARLTVFAERWGGPVSPNGGGDAEEPPTFPHLRVAGCVSCSQYLIEVDLQRDARAVPEVDELAALPLDLYAADQGLTKLTPNLMGF